MRFSHVSLHFHKKVENQKESANNTQSLHSEIKETPEEREAEGV